MECLLCLLDKSHEIQSLLNSKGASLLTSQAKAIQSDLIIMVAYMCAIFAFKRKMLIQVLVCFVVSVAFFQSDLIAKIESYQVHVVYLIIFSFAARYYFSEKYNKLFYPCFVMVIFQGVMTADAFVNNYETIFSIYYEINTAIIHCVIISADFWRRGYRFNWRRTVNHIRVFAANTYSLSWIC